MASSEDCGPFFELDSFEAASSRWTMFCGGFAASRNGKTNRLFARSDTAEYVDQAPDPPQWARPSGRATAWSKAGASGLGPLSLRERSDG
jgi:hypothetical protein